MNHFFAKNLKLIRTEKMLSQAELGEHLNKGQKTIGNWETGYSEPCMDDLLRISEFFDIGIDCLLKQQITRDNTKTKADQSKNDNSHNRMQAQKLPVVITDIKRILQENIPNGSATAGAEIVWRDQYIAVMENRLSGMTNYFASEETMQNLVNRITNLQKMVAGLAGSVYASKDSDIHS